MNKQFSLFSLSEIYQFLCSFPGKLLLCYSVFENNFMKTNKQAVLIFLLIKCLYTALKHCIEFLVSLLIYYLINCVYVQMPTTIKLFTFSFQRKNKIHEDFFPILFYAHWRTKEPFIWEIYYIVHSCFLSCYLYFAFYLNFAGVPLLRCYYLP